MFTGLIREFGEVESFRGDLLTIKAKHKPKIGDSIAVNGACLTVVEFGEGHFSVELSNETKSVVAIENYKELVHIEPAMRLSDRVEGHLVQGHVDTIGEIKKINKNGQSYDFFIKIKSQYMVYIVQKGSIAIDGVSLTVNDVESDGVRLTIIPHTMVGSLFGEYKVGRRVNVETDMINRALYSMIHKKKSLTWDDIDNIAALY